MNYYSTPNKKVLLALTAIVAFSLVGLFLTPGLTGMTVLENRTTSNGTQNIVSPQNTAPITAPIVEPVCTDVEEKYYEIEPYDEEQCMEIPTTERICNTQNILYSLNKECYWSGNFDTLNAKCVLKNIDDREATFMIDVGVITTNGKISEEKAISLLPQTSSEFTYSYDTDLGNCVCDVTVVPTKEICYDKMTSKQECFTVTKYRQIEKTKIVTKCD